MKVLEQRMQRVYPNNHMVSLIHVEPAPPETFKLCLSIDLLLFSRHASMSILTHEPNPTKQHACRLRLENDHQCYRCTDHPLIAVPFS